MSAQKRWKEVSEDGIVVSKVKWAGGGMSKSNKANNKSNLNELSQKSRVSFNNNNNKKTTTEVHVK